MRIPTPAPAAPPLSWKQTFRENARHTKQGILLTWRASRPLSAAIGGLTLLAAMLSPLMAYVGKWIIDAVVAREAEQAVRMVVLEFGLLALSSITQRGLFLCRTLLGNRLGINVNTMILEKAVTLDLAQIENSEFYDQMNRARQEASSRSLALVTDVFQFLQNALTLAGYFALLWAFSGWAILALVLASIPATFAEMKFSNIGFRLYNWRSADRRRLAYMEYVLANDSHAKEVRIFGLARRFLNNYSSLAERFFREDKALSTRRTIWVIGLTLLSSAAFYGCYLAIALSAVKGAITLGSLTLYVVVFRQGQQAFQSCLTAVGGMYEHNLYLSNLFSFLALTPAPKALKKSATEKRPGIFFDRVSFRYPNRENWALKNFTLHIPQGQSVAIVGSNGAGKSTMIKLLCGLYRPTEGAVYLDGQEVSSDPEILQRISLVFQDFNKYQLSLQENVGVGEVGKVEENSLVERAMHKGGSSDLLNEMNLSTTLGTWFPGGRELSGGQWQKVAVSRAFMREGADILILDEPTAALDAEAEHRAFEMFRALTLGKTSLIISHRFPVARLADHIVVMEAGEILEEGSHDNLLAAGGRYATLFQLQAKGYH
jgi:ATP-binding cassette subfamily B protein